MRPLCEENGSATADPPKKQGNIECAIKSAFTTPLGHLQLAMHDEVFGSTDLHSEMVIIHSSSIVETHAISVIDGRS